MHGFGCEDLAQQEREMYELDNRKDQVMTICKVAQEQSRLPDGRYLLFRVQGTGILPLDAQEKAVA